MENDGLEFGGLHQYGLTLRCLEYIILTASYGYGLSNSLLKRRCFSCPALSYLILYVFSDENLEFKIYHNNNNINSNN